LFDVRHKLRPVYEDLAADDHVVLWMIGFMSGEQCVGMIAPWR